MRSESEVRWIRAKNKVGQRTVRTDWHAMIAGFGNPTDPPPGTACGVALTGSLQTVQHSSIKSLDGQQHDICVELVNEWLADVIGQSVGLVTPPDPEIVYSPPKTSWSEGGPEVQLSTRKISETA